MKEKAHTVEAVNEETGALNVKGMVNLAPEEEPTSPGVAAHPDLLAQYHQLEEQIGQLFLEVGKKANEMTELSEAVSVEESQFEKVRKNLEKAKSRVDDALEAIHEMNREGKRGRQMQQDLVTRMMELAGLPRGKQFNLDIQTGLFTERLEA